LAIKSGLLFLNSVVGECFPAAAEVYGSKVKDRLCSVDFPSHSGSAKAVANDMLAGTLDDSAANRISPGKVFVILHGVAIVSEIVDGMLDFLSRHATPLLLVQHSLK
jgi:hypothetical protein